MTARELAKLYGYDIGCMDSGCMFGAPSGMRTNGAKCYCPGGSALRVSSASQSELNELRNQVRSLARLLAAIAAEDRR